MTEELAGADQRLIRSVHIQIIDVAGGIRVRGMHGAFDLKGQAGLRGIIQLLVDAANGQHTGRELAGLVQGAPEAIITSIVSRLVGAGCLLPAGEDAPQQQLPAAALSVLAETADRSGTTDWLACLAATRFVVLDERPICQALADALFTELGGAATIIELSDSRDVEEFGLRPMDVVLFDADAGWPTVDDHRRVVAVSVQGRRPWAAHVPDSETATLLRWWQERDEATTDTSPRRQRSLRLFARAVAAWIVKSAAVTAPEDDWSPAALWQSDTELVTNRVPCLPRLAGFESHPLDPADVADAEDRVRSMVADQSDGAALLEANNTILSVFEDLIGGWGGLFLEAGGSDLPQFPLGQAVARINRLPALDSEFVEVHRAAISTREAYYQTALAGVEVAVSAATALSDVSAGWSLPEACYRAVQRAALDIPAQLLAPVPADDLTEATSCSRAARFLWQELTASGRPDERTHLSLAVAPSGMHVATWTAPDGTRVRRAGATAVEAEALVAGDLVAAASPSFVVLPDAATWGDVLASLSLPPGLVQLQFSGQGPLSRLYFVARQQEER